MTKYDLCCLLAFSVHRDFCKEYTLVQSLCKDRATYTSCEHFLRGIAALNIFFSVAYITHWSLYYSDLSHKVQDSTIALVQQSHVAVYKLALQVKRKKEINNRTLPLSAKTTYKF